MEKWPHVAVFVRESARVYGNKTTGRTAAKKVFRDARAINRISRPATYALTDLVRVHERAFAVYNFRLRIRCSLESRRQLEVWLILLLKQIEAILIRPWRKIKLFSQGHE